MRFRTVGLKLSLALVALVAGALAVVYIAVVPTLRDVLVDGRIAQLERTARTLEPMVSDLRKTASSARRLVSPEGAMTRELDATLRELRAASRSARRLTDQVSRDPGSLLRGGRQ